MNNIDILEEMLKNTKTNRRGNKEIKFEVNSNYYTAILNLIAENKELKEKIKEINEEYNAEQKHEMENTIPKSKVQRLIDEINKDYEDSKDEYGESEYYYPDYTIEKLYSLLRKE